MNYEFGLDINDLVRNEHEALTFAFNYQSQQYPLSPMSSFVVSRPSARARAWCR